jgi:hypothetical protein
MIRTEAERTRRIEELQEELRLLLDELVLLQEEGEQSDADYEEEEEEEESNEEEEEEEENQQSDADNKINESVSADATEEPPFEWEDSEDERKGISETLALMQTMFPFMNTTSDDAGTAAPDDGASDDSETLALMQTMFPFMNTTGDDADTAPDDGASDDSSLMSEGELQDLKRRRME